MGTSTAITPPTATGGGHWEPSDGRASHLALVADSEGRQREVTGSWLDDELGRGAKVYYKGWFDPTAPARHWLAGPDGPRRGRAALEDSQIELCDFATVIERCGGTTEGLHRLQTDEVTRAMDEGWPSVAMVQESPGRPMADEAEAAAFAAQEAGYDRLVERWPLRVLCQLTTPAENDAAIWRTALVHHRALRDGRWSAVTEAGRWQVAGELDAHVVRRFSGALVGALRDAADATDGPDLHVDLAGVTFLDIACARMLTLAARSTAVGQRVVVHGASRIVRRAVEAVGRPDTLDLLEEAS